MLLDIDEFHSTTVDIAKKKFLVDESCPNLLLAHDGDGNMFGCARPFSSGAEKLITYNFYIGVLAMRNAVIYSLTAEAWMKAFKDGEKTSMPRHHSDRKEILSIHTTNINKDQRSTWFDIIHSTDGASLVENKIIDGAGSVDGLATELLVKNTIPDNVKADFNKLPKPDWYFDL